MNTTRAKFDAHREAIRKIMNDEDIGFRERSRRIRAEKKRFIRLACRDKKMAREMNEIMKEELGI